ncbi:MAG: HIT domain-containing protein, partial [bacterium]|nr:HIT domain-containing protein [bacterium]
AKDLAKRLNLKGYKLVFNVGKAGGQIIDHLHLHLLGGWSHKKDVDAMPDPGLDK